MAPRPPLGPPGVGRVARRDGQGRRAGRRGRCPEPASWPGLGSRPRRPFLKRTQPPSPASRAGQEGGGCRPAVEDRAAPGLSACCQGSSGERGPLGRAAAVGEGSGRRAGWGGCKRARRGSGPGGSVPAGPTGRPGRGHCPTLCHVPRRGRGPAHVAGLRDPGPGPIPVNAGRVKERGLPGLPVPPEGQMSQPAPGPSASCRGRRERLPRPSTETRAAAPRGYRRPTRQAVTAYAARPGPEQRHRSDVCASGTPGPLLCVCQHSRPSCAAAGGRTESPVSRRRPPEPL